MVCRGTIKSCKIVLHCPPDALNAPPELKNTKKVLHFSANSFDSKRTCAQASCLSCEFQSTDTDNVIGPHSWLHKKLWPEGVLHYPEPRSQLSPKSQDPMMMDGTWPWHRTLALRYPHRLTPLLEESVCCYKRTALILTANGPDPAWIQVPARNSPPTDSHGFDEEPGLQPKHIWAGWNFLPLWKYSTNIFLLVFCPFTTCPASPQPLNASSIGKVDSISVVPVVQSIFRTRW